MAQYFTDFSEYVLGEPPGDWVKQVNGDEVSLEVVTHNAFAGLKITTTQVNIRRALVRWDKVPPTYNSNFFTVWYADTDRHDARVASRINTDRVEQSNITCYMDGARRNTSDIRINSYNNGSFSNHLATDWAENGPYFGQMVSVEGNECRVSVWSAVSLDNVYSNVPAEYDYSATRPDFPAGKVGVLIVTHSNYSLGHTLLAYGVGTDGDPAPTGPVTPTQRKTSPLIWSAF